MNGVPIKIGDKISCRNSNSRRGTIDNNRTPKIGIVNHIYGTSITFTDTPDLSYIRPSSKCEVMQ